MYYTFVQFVLFLNSDVAIDTTEGKDNNDLEENYFINSTYGAQLASQLDRQTDIQQRENTDLATIFSQGQTNSSTQCLTQAQQQQQLLRSSKRGKDDCDKAASVNTTNQQNRDLLSIISKTFRVN